MDLQSSMLLETLRQTPSIQDNIHLDSGGSAGDGNAKSTSSSSLSSSVEGGGGGGGVGINSDGGEKTALEAMDPAILSASAPSGAESPVSGSSASEKSNRTRYSINQLLALRNLEPSKQKPIFMVEPKSEKLARMFSILDRTTDRYGKSLSIGKSSEAAYEDENGGGGNGSAGNYGRNRVANGSGGGNGDGGSSGGGNRMEMRRSGGMELRDPKDRLRKEDGIVLSPQRRSFNMGCQMPAAPSANTSGLTIGGNLLRNERDILGGRERRIGSGRILSRDVSWDYRPDKDAPESNDYRASGNPNYRERERNDKEFRKDYDRDREDGNRFERRPNNREFDRNEKDSRNNRMSSRYSNSYNNDSHGGGNYHSNNYNNHYHSSHHDRRRLYSDHNRDEEPEWFSEPTCQTDTIELRGFDDPVSEEETTKSDKEDARDDLKQDLPEATNQRPASSLQQNDKNNNANASSEPQSLNRTDNANANQLPTPATAGTAADKMDRTPGDGASEGSSAKSGLGATTTTTTLGGIAGTISSGQSKINDDDFNFEDFLKLDALPSSLLYPDLPASKDSGNAGGSRFSQWFRQDSSAPSQPTQSTGPNQPQQQPKQQSSHFNDSRRSSLQDEIINNMINDFTSTGLDDHIPDTNSNKYFAPISPAASTSSNSLMELFQRSDKQLQQQQQQQQQQQHHQQPQQRDREHLQQQQQQIPPPQPPNHPHGQPLLAHPPNHPGLHHQQQQQQQHHQQIQNRNLQQLLGVSGSGNVSNHGPHGPIPPAPSGGQIHSVEELEARFRQSDNDVPNRPVGVGPSIPRLITPSSGGGGGGSSGGINVGGNAGHSSNDAQQQEMNAFKKLLAQISENQPHNVQPNPPAHPPHPINMLHHQQQQNELLQKMLHLNQMHHPVNDARQAEILKRPEAQALLHGVARGEVSQHNLWQQLTNPATAQPHREILTSVLSTINTSPRVVSPNILIQPSPGGVPILPPATVPPAAVAAAAAANSANLLFQHHSKQQMRLSPLPNGMPQRIPSPRELQYHTQSIMQNALIRKKLEEQRENYRKRQEQQQQQQQNRNQPETSAASSSTASAAATTLTTTSSASSSSAAPNHPQSGNQPANSTATIAPASVVPSPAVSAPVMASSIASPAKPTPPSHSHSQHTSSPTPLAFTPTSVLRKMTAEKETEQLTANSSSNTPSHSTISSAPPIERPPLGAANHGQNLLMGLQNPLSQQQQQQQRNLAALIGSHPPLQPPHSQSQGPPPQIPPHHHMGNAHLHGSSLGPQNAQPPQPNHQQMRGGHQPPGMPGGNIPWNLKQPHPGQQMPQLTKPQGRPILKGGNTQQQPPQQQQHPSPMSQMSFASNLEFQQQMQQFQGRSGNPILGAHQSQQQQQQMLQQQQPHNQHQNQMNPHLQQLLQQRQQQQQQQQRAIRNQHMQQMPQSFRMGPQQQQQQPQSQGPHPHQGQPQSGASGIINYNRDGGLSPTSNQLARWFSPELLAQASAGKLPSLNIGQAMSLEEFERNMQHSSATVHN